METVSNPTGIELSINKDAIFLQAMQIFNDAMTKYHQIEYHDGVRLISIEDASRLLGGLNRKEVKKLYEKGKIVGYRKNNNVIVIRSDSVVSYIMSLDKITQNEYFTNEQKSLQKARNTSRSEIEKFIKK